MTTQSVSIEGPGLHDSDESGRHVFLGLFSRALVVFGLPRGGSGCLWVCVRVRVLRCVLLCGVGLPVWLVLVVAVRALVRRPGWGPASAGLRAGLSCRLWLSRSVLFFSGFFCGLFISQDTQGCRRDLLWTSEGRISLGQRLTQRQRFKNSTLSAHQMSPSRVRECTGTPAHPS